MLPRTTQEEFHRLPKGHQQPKADDIGEGKDSVPKASKGEAKAANGDAKVATTTADKVDKGEKGDKAPPLRVHKAPVKAPAVKPPDSVEPPAKAGDVAGHRAEGGSSKRTGEESKVVSKAGARIHPPLKSGGSRASDSKTGGDKAGDDSSGKEADAKPKAKASGDSGSHSSSVGRQTVHDDSADSKDRKRTRSPSTVSALVILGIITAVCPAVALTC